MGKLVNPPTVGLMTILHPKRFEVSGRFPSKAYSPTWFLPRSRSKIREHFPKHPHGSSEIHVILKSMELETWTAGWDLKWTCKSTASGFSHLTFGACTLPAAKVLTMVLLAWFCLGQGECRLDLTWNQDLNLLLASKKNQRVLEDEFWLFSESLPAGSNFCGVSGSLLVSGNFFFTSAILHRGEIGQQKPSKMLVK